MVPGVRPAFSCKSGAGRRHLIEFHLGIERVTTAHSPSSKKAVSKPSGTPKGSLLA
jgi:hypothetical protein